MERIQPEGNGMITKRKINHKREGGLIIAKGDLMFKKTTNSQKQWAEETEKQRAKDKRKVFR